MTTTLRPTQTHRLTDNVTRFTLLFNYRIAIGVESTNVLHAHIGRRPRLVDLLQHLFSTNCCDTIVRRWTFCVRSKFNQFPCDMFAENKNKRNSTHDIRIHRSRSCRRLTSSFQACKKLPCTAPAWMDKASYRKAVSTSDNIPSCQLSYESRVLMMYSSGSAYIVPLQRNLQMFMNAIVC